MTNKILLGAMSVLFAGSALQAAPVTNLRQLNQERRIDAGTRSGKLTRAEAARLKTEQRNIAQLERQPQGAARRTSYGCRQATDPDAAGTSQPPHPRTEKRHAARAKPLEALSAELSHRAGRSRRSARHS